MYQVNVKKIQRMARRIDEAKAAAAKDEPLPPGEPAPDRFRDGDGRPQARPCEKCARPFATRSGMEAHLEGYHTR